MKASDFDMQRDLVLNPQTGVAQFHDTRLVVFAADAMGLLRDEIVSELGWQRARRLLLRFGYQHGFADLVQMKVSYDFETEMDLLGSGPVIHSWEGIVQASPLGPPRFSRETGEFFFAGVWENSYEAEQHLTFRGPATEPVCWSLMGYASGYATAFFGSPLLAIEPVCAGKGDHRCEWKIQPPAAWGAEAAPYSEALADLLARGA